MKPREYWLSKAYVKLNSTPKPSASCNTETCYIEKSAADKLAAALDFIYEHSTLTAKGRDDMIRQVLKEYRGEE